MFLAQFVYDALLTVAYPQVCTICSHSVERSEFGVACEECWEKTRVFTDEETICCEPQFFTAARAIGPYEGALRESVLELKRQPYLPEHVEALLTAVAMRAPLNTITRIVPVPLHEQRKRTRGFNQATVLAESLSKRLGLPVDEVSLWRVSSSEKYRAGLDAKGRRETVAGAFEVRHPKLIANESILLVDDVFTTGATVSACAEALMTAGAGNVYVLTIARASL